MDINTFSTLQINTTHWSSMRSIINISINAHTHTPTHTYTHTHTHTHTDIHTHNHNKHKVHKSQITNKGSKPSWNHKYSSISNKD